MIDLRGKVAVVTGASKGIGAGIAKRLADVGAAVAVVYSSSREGADEVVRDIVSRDGKAVAIHADVSKAADVKRMFAETKKAFGRLDVLVNNAGIFKFEPLEAVTEAEFHRQYGVNVLGPLLTIQESLNYFGPDGGSIVNVGSVVSTNAVPGASVYAGTKGALDAVTRVLGAELAPRKIRVNTVAPGPVETEGSVAAGMIGSDFEKQMVAATPLGRIGQPADIAKVVAFLASDASSWLTGERIAAAGGFR